LTANTTYEWKVQSICNGDPTLFSPLTIFTTTDTCTSAGAIYQVDVSYNMAIIGWDAFISADTFKIIYAEQGTSNYKMKTILGSPNYGHGQISNLTPDSYYSVKVRTKCTSGGRSSWSAPLVIHTLPTPVVRLDSSDPLHLNAYPNPVQETLKYAFTTDKSSEYTLKVTDMSGREILHTVRNAVEGLNGDNLNVSKYANGMYMLIVEQGPSVSRFKFSVE
ncbi:MAG: T9SS type A sorting domain-containing protein, partial [Bacteroidota bacterium]